MTAKKINQNVIAITKLLSDGKFHDGTLIGKELDITRTSVWKVIHKLKNYKIPIDSVKGKGYILQQHPLILLNKQEIQKRLNKSNITIDLFESLPSTNDYLKDFCHKDEIRICISEQQTKGRGRLNRSWHSPFAQNIYFSVLYPIQHDVSLLSGLSLITSLSLAKTLNTVFPTLEAKIKWPNDVFVDGKKLAGSLIDIQAESHGITYAIIGIGINVNMMQTPPKTIPQPWTSIRKACSIYVDRNVLIAEVLNNLFLYLNRFLETGFSDFIEEWKSNDYLWNKQVTLSNGVKNYTGISLGINPLGHLRIQGENKEEWTFSSGDASIDKKSL